MGAIIPERWAASNRNPGRDRVGIRILHLGERVLGAVPFGPGDRVCLEDCSGTGARWYRLAPGGRRLEIEGGHESLPPFPERAIFDPFDIPIGEGVTFWNSLQRIYPLRDFGTPEVSLVGRWDRPCEERRFVCVHGPDGALRPARTFLYHRGGQLPFVGAEMRILLLDPGARLARVGIAPIGFHDVRFDPAPARSISLKLHVLQLADSETRPSDPKEQASHLSRGIDIVLRNAEGLDASLKNPHIIALSDEQTQIALVGASAPPKAGAVSLAQIGGDLGRSISGAICPAASGLESCGIRGVMWRDAGQSAPCPQPRCAVLVVERLPYPSLPLYVALAWALVGTLMFRNRWRRAPGLVGVAAMMQLLLALRVVVAVEGVWLDPQLPWRSLVGAAVVVYVATPVLMLTLCSPREPKWTPRWALSGFVLSVLATVWLGYGVAPLLAWLIVLLAATTALIGPEFRWPLTGAGSAPPADDASRGGSLVRLARGAPAAEGRLSAAALGIILLAAAGIGRVMVRFVGVSERLPFPPPFDIAVTVVYVPALVCGFAMLLSGAGSAKGGREGWLAVAFCGLMALDVVIAPSLSHDFGFSIYLLPLAGLAAAQALDAIRGRRPSVALGWIAPSAILGIIAIVLVGYAQWGAYQGRSDLQFAIHADSGHDKDAAQRVSRMAEHDQNQLRIFNAFAPDRLAVSGTQWSETLRLWSADLADYTRSFAGRGYMTRSDLGLLSEVQMSDNVSAIHIIAPFGRAGAAWLLAVLLLGAFAFDAGIEASKDWRVIAGRLAVWIVFSAGAYMVLANLQLVPFTGRNIYWLEAASNSDLLEGAALFFLALLATRLAKMPEGIRN